MQDNIKYRKFIMEDLIPLSKYSEYYDFPSVGALRQYIFHEKKYNFQNVYKKVGNRLYISISEFNKYSRSKRNNKPEILIRIICILPKYQVLEI